MTATDLKRRTLALATGRLSYCEAGSGPALMFLHGMNGSCRSWLKQFEYFTGDYRVIAWDAPGYGRSELVEPTTEAYADAALAAAEALGVEKMGVVGHSMGGIIAAKMAVMAPEKVSGLVLSSTYTGRAQPPEAPLQERYTRRINELKELPLAEYVSRRARAVLPEGTEAAVVEFIEAIAAEMRIDGLMQAATMAHHADNRPLLPRIVCPTLILTAALDRVLPYRFSLPFIESIPAARHVEIENVGHAAYVEDHATYNRILTGFLAGCLNP